jgi:hypothetical protein
MVGGGGADLFQVGNNSTDVLVFDALDQINSFDQARDVFIAEVPGTPVPPPGVFNPSRPITNTNNIWFSQSVANQGFINATNFPLVAEAYVRYLYRLLIGGDPDTANGARIVSFWTQRVASQSLTSFDLVRAFLTQNVANIGGTNPPPAQYFADYFFNGFARREIGDPFAGQDRARLADMVKGGMSLETVSRLAGFTVSDSTLARAWSREYMYNLLSTQLDEALREDASRAFLATPPASRTLRSSINAVTDLLRRDQRPWINALLTIINGTEGLRGAIRLASVENPVRFSPLMDAASLPSTKLGSFEPGGWFLDVPPGRARELFPTGVNFGVPSDTPVPGDWNGDGNDDFGVFRQGSWFLDTNGTEGWQAGDTSVSFGVGSDAPVAGDWSGQGRSRLGVFRQGTWFLDSNNSLGWQGDDTTATFGVAGDTPFVGDWNGDGVTDLGVRRGNVFFLDTNGVRGWQGNDTSFADTFGAGRILVSDFNGDGRDDIAVVNGNRWRIDFAGPFGFQPDADAELFFDSNEGVPVIMARSPISLTRQQSVPAGSTASLLTGPILFSAPAPSTGSTSTTSSTGGTNSSSSESGSPSSGTGTVGQPLLLGRSRLPFGSAGETGPTLTIDELEESEQWMLAESDSDAIDRVFAELG